MEPGVVGTETGACNTESITEPFSFTEEALEILLRICVLLWNMQKKLGVIVAIEPVCRHIVNNASVQERFLMRLILESSDHLDPVNLLDESNYQEYPAIFKRVC